MRTSFRKRPEFFDPSQRFLCSADNVTANAGSGGAVFKTDEDTGASAHVPVTKIELGANNTFDGYVSSTNPMPMQPIEATGSGSLTAVDQTASIDVKGLSSVAIQITGTWVATVGFDGTVDGSNWVDLPMVPIAGGDSVTTTTANGIWLVNCGGLNQVRAYSDAFTSGTITVNLQANNGPAPTRDLISIDDNGGNVTVDNAGTFGVQVDAALPAGDNNIGNVDIASSVALDVSAATVNVAGESAEGFAASGNPVLIAGDDGTNLKNINVDGTTGDVQVDVTNTVTVDNAGTFAVQISDTSFAVADGNALGEGVLIQGDDGTDRKNINVDATTGDVQVDVTNTVTVDGSGVTQPVSQSTASNLNAQVVGNAASGAADSGNPVKIGAIYNSTKPTFTNGQRGNLQIGTRGSLQVSQFYADTNVSNVGLADNADAVAVSATANKSGVQARNTVYNGTTWDRMRGNTTGTYVHAATAHDAADAGNPIKIGAVAESDIDTITLVADGDRTNLLAGRDGVQYVRQDGPLENLVNGNGNATTTSDTSVIAAQGAGIKTYLTDIIITNASATDSEVIIKDGTTEKLRITAPANGGAVSVGLRSPIAGTANTAWQFASVDAVTTMYVFMSGFTSQI